MEVLIIYMVKYLIVTHINLSQWFVSNSFFLGGGPLNKSTNERNRDIGGEEENNNKGGEVKKKV